MRRRFSLIAVLALAIPVSAQPAADPATQVERVEAAYENLAYDEAEALARSALARYEVFAPGQLIRLHTTLALIHFARGENLEAGEQFRAALTLDPNLNLDPVLVSPVTLAFFEETRASYLRERNSETSPESEVRYVQLQDVRPAATWRSAVVPGWGQQIKGEATKGWILTGLWVATLGAAAGAHLRRRDARDAYLAETNPALIEERFDEFNAWHKVRGGLLLGAGAVWIYSTADALLTGGPERPLQLSAHSSGIALRLHF